MTSPFAGLSNPLLTTEEVLGLTAMASDAELVYRQTELLDLFAAVGRSTAARWFGELLAASARLPTAQQQRLADGRARALAHMPAAKRGQLVDDYVAAVAALPPHDRERELRLTRRALRALPRDRAAVIEARLPR